MGTLNLFYKDWQGDLWRWPLTDITAWANEVPVSGQPRDLTAAAQIPSTATLELFYVDEATGEIQILDSQSGGPWSPAPPLPGPVVGNITAAVVPGTEYLQIFYRNSSQEVITWWREGAGTWSGPQSLAGDAVSDIAAIQVPGSQILHLFYRGGAGGVQALWRNPDGSWPSEPLGGNPTGNISVCRVPGSNALNLFYRGPNGEVITRQRTAGGSWAGEQTLAGTSTGDITAVILPTPIEDILQVFYRGTSGQVMTMWRDPATGNFNAESPVGGQVIADGAITAARIPGTATLGLFYRGSSSALMSNFRPENGTWTGETDQGGDLQSDITAAAIPEPFVPVPPNGLTSNSNYFLYADTPIIDFNVTIEITEDIVGDVGFGFQLNGWSPTGDLSLWQQYVLALPNSNQLWWMVENWNVDMSVNIIDWNQPWISIPQTNTIPAGWRLMISLSNDPEGNVRNARFLVVDNEGTVRGNVLKDLLTLHSDNKGVVAPITQPDLAPVRAVQVTLVGPTTTNSGPLQFGTTRLTGGAGTMTYAASTPMTIVDGRPPGTTGFKWPAQGNSEGTGEKANSSYGLLPAGPDYSFTQSFTTFTPPEQILGVDGSGHVHEFASSDGNHWAQTDLTTAPGSPPAASGPSVSGYQWAQELAKMVVYLDGSGHVIELSRDPSSSWSHADLSAITDAPAAVAGSAISGYSWADGPSKQVVYLDASHHVNELFVAKGAKSWGHANLTVMTGGTPARPGSPLCGYEWPAGNSKQVVYIDGSGQVNELWIVSGASWGHANLSAMTAAPAAAPTSSLSSYSWAEGPSKQVVYLDSSGHVHELFISPGAKWAHADLTALTSAPAAAAGSALVGYGWAAGNSKQVAYLDGAGHVHELWVVKGGHWAHADLTSLAGAPPAAAGSALTGYQWAAGRSKQVGYLDPEGHVHQLRIASGGAWNHLDLTAAAGGPGMVGASPLSGYEWLSD